MGGINCKRMFAQLDIINMAWLYITEMAVYRRDKAEYQNIYKRNKPICPNLVEDYQRILK